MGRRERHYEPGANLEEEEERTRAEAISTLVGAASGRRPEESPRSAGGFQGRGHSGGNAEEEEESEGLRWVESKFVVATAGYPIRTGLDVGVDELGNRLSPEKATMLVRTFGNLRALRKRNAPNIDSDSDEESAGESDTET